MTADDLNLVQALASVFQTVVLVLQTLVLAVTLAFAAWYASETHKLRVQVSHQSQDLSRQTEDLQRNLRVSAYNDAMLGQRNLWLSFFLRNHDTLAWYLQSRGIRTTNTLEDERRLYAVLKFDFFESLFLRHQEHVLSEDAWSGWLRVIATDLKLTAFKETWPCVRTFYAATFTNFIDGSLAEIQG